MDELDTRQPEGGDGCAAKPDGRKAAYRKPVLETYGSVAELTRGGGFSLFDGFMTTKMSDARAKESIVRIGTHDLGIGVYAYRYHARFRDRWGHGVQFGVMAQEVEAVMPRAVSMGDDGFKRVDYRILADARG